MNSLDQLPTEILSLILEQVDQSDLYPCTLINHQFYIAATPLLWRTLIIHHGGDAATIITTSLLESPHALLGNHVRHLDFGYFEMTDDLFLQWLPHLPNLESLAMLSGEHITDTSFQQLPHYCPHLQSLQLRYCPITQNSIFALGQRCHRLREIDLHGCTNLSNDTFSALTRCPLEKLAISANFPFILDWMTIQKTLVDLTQYELLTDLLLTSASTPFTKQLLLSNNNDSPAWPRLMHLTLEDCVDFGDHELIWFIKTHPTLTSLTIIRGDLTDATLDTIATYLPDILHVDISRNNTITPHGLRRMVRHCHRLTSVSLYACNLTMSEFPEAGSGCIDSVDRRLGQQPQEMYLHQLDQDAINKIRLELEL